MWMPGTVAETCEGRQGQGEAPCVVVPGAER